jgi:CRISPR-associated protein Cmr6
MSIAAIPAYLDRHDPAHASPALRFGLLLPVWSRDFSKDKDNSKAWGLICALNETDRSLMTALAARQAAISGQMLQQGALVVFDAVSTAPFATGLGNEHPLENGFAFLDPYGLPYLPGSGVKGVLRQAARELAAGMWGETHGWTPEAITILFGAEDPNHARRGALMFHDAIPQVRTSKLLVEVMTPHQKHYYQDSDAPHDSGTPVPIKFLTVPPGTEFCFLVGCNPALLRHDGLELDHEAEWKRLLAAAFEHAFDWLGFGAKTAVGYGVMQPDRKAQQKRQEEEQARREAEQHQRKLEAIQAQLPEDAGWIEARRISGDWTDTDRFLTDVEAFLDERDSLSQQAWERLSDELEQRYSGILTDPDAVQGKKKKAKYKDRPRALAKRLLVLSGKAAS